jgi:hypothetical protein
LHIFSLQRDCPRVAVYEHALLGSWCACCWPNSLDNMMLHLPFFHLCRTPIFPINAPNHIFKPLPFILTCLTFPFLLSMTQDRSVSFLSCVFSHSTFIGV